MCYKNSVLARVSTEHRMNPIIFWKSIKVVEEADNHSYRHCISIPSVKNHKRLDGQRSHVSMRMNKVGTKALSREMHHCKA